MWDLPKVSLSDGQRSFTSQKGELQMVTVVETVSRVITVQTTQTREVQTTRERKPGPVWSRGAHSWENTLIRFFPVSAAEIYRRTGSVWGCCPRHVEMLSPVPPCSTPARSEPCQQPVAPGPAAPSSCRRRSRAREQHAVLPAPPAPREAQRRACPGLTVRTYGINVAGAHKNPVQLTPGTEAGDFPWKVTCSAELKYFLVS